MAPDLGARAYRIEKAGFSVTVGWLMSWYTLAWRHETAVLFKEA
jgi:hypothetical protein